MKLLDYEQLGTSAVTDAIAKTSKLKADIKSGDREPTYDGHIYIYDNKKYKKNNLKKVYVQVKAKGVTSKFNSTIKYPISVIDLSNFMRNGGAMYFVVYINKNTPDKKQIYYASLLPFKISELLKDKPDNKKTINVQLRRFPTNEDEITDLLLNFYSDAQKQISFAGKELPSIEDLQKQGVLESVSFSYVSLKGGKNISDYPKILDGKEIYLYANVKGGVAPIPVECCAEMSQLHMSSTEDVSITVNGVKYYEQITKTITADKIVTQIGTSVTITAPNESTNIKSKEKIKITLSIKLKGTLKERVQALKFIIALLRAKTFNLNDVPFPVTFSEEDWKKFNPDSFEKELSGYDRVLAVFEKMNITKDLDIDKFTKDDYWKLNSLVAAIEDETPVKNAKNDLPCIVNLNFGGLHLVMVSKKQEDGSYKIWDYFNKQLDVCIFDEDKNPIPVSQFSIMKADDFLSIDNLNCKKIVEDFKRFEPQEFIAENGNTVMLEMLKAYDQNKSTILFEAVKEMMDWLLGLKEYFSDNILELNNLQILRRKRNLTFKEKQKLTQIASQSKDIACQIGALILLDEMDEADKLLAEMPSENSEKFKEYPIYKFYNDYKEKNKNG